jgi:uncharacterized membrane protein
MKNLNRSQQIRVLTFLMFGLVIAFAILYPILPDVIPMQFSLSGSVNRTAPKWLALLSMFGINALMNISNIVRSKERLLDRQMYLSFGLAVFSIIMLSISMFI